MCDDFTVATTETPVRRSAMVMMPFFENVLLNATWTGLPYFARPSISWRKRANRIEYSFIAIFEGQGNHIDYQRYKFSDGLALDSSFRAIAASCSRTGFAIRILLRFAWEKAAQP